MSSLAKENKKANLRRDLALLHMKAELRFHGYIVIESREDATLTATTISTSEPVDGPRQLAFSVDGSRFINIKEKRKRKAPGSGKTAGATVVYQTETQAWEERTFCFTDGHKSRSTEIAATFHLRTIAEQGRSWTK